MRTSEVFERLVLESARTLAPACTYGRKRALDDKDALAHIFSILRTGMQWRELRAGVHCTTVLRRFHHWKRLGVFKEAYAKALRTYQKLQPPKRYCVDSSYVKNRYGREGLGKNHTDRGRKALKLSIISDDSGMVVGACCHPGNRPDVVLLDDTIRSAFVRLDALELFESELPEALKTAQKDLATHCSRSSHLETLIAYFKCRRATMMDTLAHFGDLKYRRRAWSRFIRAQKSLTKFVRRIRNMARGEDTAMVLAYGSWSSVAGRPGAQCNRGCPPCPGVGLRKKLSHHFIIVHTPEHYTSKTCSVCGSLCGPCTEVDTERRAELYACAQTDNEKKRATHFSVRGLRRCHNAQCACYLNRDLNAAINIGHRCKSLLLSGRDHLPSHTKEDDEEFSRLAAEVAPRKN